MKKNIYKIVSIATALLIVLMMLPLSAAADEEITVNGQAVSKGDTVTFEYYMSGISDAVEGVGSYIEYDSKALEYVEGSIGFDVLNNAIYNIGEGGIYYSAINVINGYDIKDEKLIVSISFKVLDGAKGNLKITNTIDEMFTLVNEEVDLTPDDYEDREVLTVNTYEKNTSPYLGMDANEAAELFEDASAATASALEGYFEGNPNENVVTSNSEKSYSFNSVDIPEEISLYETASALSEIGAEEEAVAEKDSSKATVTVIVIIFVVLVIGAAVFLILGKKNKAE